MERTQPDAPPIDRWAMDIAMQELFYLAPKASSFADEHLAVRLRRLTEQQRIFVISGLEGGGAGGRSDLRDLR